MALVVKFACLALGAVCKETIKGRWKMDKEKETLSEEK